MNYLSLWYTLGRDYGLHDGEWKMTGGAENADSMMVASEPLTRDTAAWVEVPEYSALLAELRRGQPTSRCSLLDWNDLAVQARLRGLRFFRSIPRIGRSARISRAELRIGPGERAHEATVDRVLQATPWCPSCRCRARRNAAAGSSSRQGDVSHARTVGPGRRLEDRQVADQLARAGDRDAALALAQAQEHLQRAAEDDVASLRARARGEISKDGSTNEPVNEAG